MHVERRKSIMSIWIKPNGTKIDINDNQATVEYATSLNWKPYQEAVTNDNSSTDSKRGSRKNRAKNSRG